MGRTPKPLKLLVHPDLWNAPEVQALIAKGHAVSCLEGTDVHLGLYDMVLSPNAWKMDARLLKYLDLAVKAARTIKFPKREKK